MSDKRTKAQKDFDWAVKGWAFTTPDRLARQLSRYEELLPPNDPERSDTLQAIRRAASV